MLVQRLVLLVCCADSANAFKVSGTLHAQTSVAAAPVPHASGFVTRRALCVAPMLLLPLSACAASVPSQAELSKLAKGYARLQYLLANWEQETTVCIKGCVGKPENCGCIRDPLVVQSYMGYKSMNDPLFKADQIMIRAQPLVKDADEFEKYAAAIDRLETSNEPRVKFFGLANGLIARLPRFGPRCVRSGLKGASY
mmetsp:Transcript_8514/g.18554  ORF Transcript_8514/g.18554 Transcript_8514/m.18554 type:complete len:197 (+) Transcript_8514:43-633(+)